MVFNQPTSQIINIRNVQYTHRTCTHTHTYMHTYIHTYIFGAQPTDLTNHTYSIRIAHTHAYIHTFMVFNQPTSQIVQYSHRTHTYTYIHACMHACICGIQPTDLTNLVVHGEKACLIRSHSATGFLSVCAKYGCGCGCAGKGTAGLFLHIHYSLYLLYTYIYITLSLSLSISIYLSIYIYIYILHTRGSPSAALRKKKKI